MARMLLDLHMPSRTDTLVLSARSWMPGLLVGCILTSALFAVPAFAGSTQQSASNADPADQSDIIPLDRYRNRLQELQQLVAGCQQAMSPAVCESDKVGPDVSLNLPGGPREIRFGWLRTLLDQVAHPGDVPDEAEKPASGEATPPSKSSTRRAPQKAPNAPVRRAGKPDSDRSPTMPSPEDVIGIATTPNVFKRLDSAHRRLEQDQRWAEEAQASASVTKPLSQSQDARHRALAAILAAKEYHSAIAGATIKDRVLEKIANWIDTVLGELIKAGSKSKWIGLTAEIGFIALLFVVLVWLLIRLERQGRFGSPSIRPGPGTNAASARDWQLWIADARQSADRSEWRDAIHYLYWGSISRLESSGLWPADRARTPREYLALLSSESTRQSDLHPNLVALTSSLERTWYAGHPAAESDYQRAEQLAASLGAEERHKSRKEAVSR